MLTHHKKLNTLQIDLLKSIQYIDTQEKIEELNSLINFYLEKKLDEAIDSEESKRNYTADIYNQWLLDTKKAKVNNTITNK